MNEGGGDKMLMECWWNVLKSIINKSIFWNCIYVFYFVVYLKYFVKCMF